MVIPMAIYVLFALELLPQVSGHAFLFQPASRNLKKHTQSSEEGRENCPHCGQGGGPPNVKEKANGKWPTVGAPGSHGLCGDPFQGRENTPLADEPYLVYTNTPQRSYVAGGKMEILVAISTHHRGHFEFRVCDRKLDSTLESYDAGQQCLNKWVLERADPAEVYGDCVVNDPRGDCQPLDPNHPGRWYLPPPGNMVQVAGPDWSDDMANYVNGFEGNLPTGADLYYMVYKVPEGLSCEECTLQWYWSTGNTCLYDVDYVSYFQSMQAAGWNARAWDPFGVESWGASMVCDSETFPEEFWNCADIAVVSGSPTTESTAAPTSAPVLVSTPAPTGTPTLAPSSALTAEPTLTPTTPDLQTPSPSPNPTPAVTLETGSPSSAPTAEASAAPTPSSTNAPSEAPATQAPSSAPSEAPAPVSGATCCWWGTDPNDVCGTCVSRAPPDNWCSLSKSQCATCGGGNANSAWCPGNDGSERTPAPTPASAGSCCYWSRDPSDPCGTCGSSALPSDWCGASEERCGQCQLLWCPATVAPATHLRGGVFFP
eukprot:TRINITY_DN19326_c0_g2_i1.p1 TRINITY_DN19326_c0_g2~~TRINITY_DN19326_c0_g2_i1.p1  ORF type:complete len:542 (+),score=40.01 TRINITY_DN19326_c0_g2_i1:70-1695(+)